MTADGVYHAVGLRLCRRGWHSLEHHWLRRLAWVCGRQRRPAVDHRVRYTPRDEECEVCGCRYVCGFSKMLDASGSPVGYRHQIEPGTLPARRP